MENGVCEFSISEDGTFFFRTGEPFVAEAGKWIGAKVGLYALGTTGTNDTGWADVDWFSIEKIGIRMASSKNLNHPVNTCGRRAQTGH